MRNLYVIAACLFLIQSLGCSLDANLADFNSQNQLFLKLDDSNFAISSSNYRSYSIKGSCQHVDEDVEIQLDPVGTFTTPCSVDKTFSLTLDLDGVADGTLTLIASQKETAALKTSYDKKSIAVDLTPPTVTIATPDSADNYSLSSMRSSYPLSGTCSEPLNVVRLTSSLSQEYFGVCTAAKTWEYRLDLSTETASSIDFYVQHFDAAGNISATQSVTIGYPQWQKISPSITATGVASVRLIAQYGDSGRIIMASPLRNDDLVDLGIVNFNNTGLTRLNPLSGQWGVDTARPILAVSKHNRVLYTRYTMGRQQLRELHSVKVDGTDDKLLMGPTVENPVGGVTTYLLTPNQNTVIAMGDIEATDNEFNLYAIDILTGAIKKLNGALVSGGDVRDFLITPDGSQVIFRADKDTDEGIDLYAVNIDGTNLRRLNPAMAAGKMVYVGYSVSPDSKWVLYRDNQSYINGTAVGLSVASLTTGENISFKGNTVAGFTEMGLFSPNSRYVAYRTDRAIATCLELLVFDLQSKNETSVSVPCVTNANDVGTFVWAPSSAMLAFGQAETASRFDVFTVAVDGTNRKKLTSATVTRNGSIQGYRDKYIMITPDSQRVIFAADFTGVIPATTAEMKFDLYSALADGSGVPVKLSTISGGSFVKDYPVLELSPSSDRIAFVGDLEVDAKYEMYVAALDGSSIRKISPVITNAQGDVLTANQNYFFDWSRNTAGMMVDTTIDGVNGLYLASLNVTASPTQYLALPSILSGDVVTVMASANKSKVLFRVNPTVDGQMHLYVADADGSNVRRVTKDYPAGGGTLRSFIITANGSKVIYIADQDTAGQEELFVADTSGGTPVKVNGAIGIPQGNVTEFKYSESTNKIIYAGDFVTDGIIDLYSVNVDGSANTKLTPAYPHTVNILNWDMASDGSFVVLRWDYHIDEKYEIDKISLAGGAPVALNTAISNGFKLTGFKISPDSTWVCYWGEISLAKRSDAKVVKVSTPATNYLADVGVDTLRMVTDCDFTQDSSHVLLKGDWYLDGKTAMKSFRLSDQQLFALNSSLPASSHTSWFGSLEEGMNKRIVTLSESSPEVYELYSMNFDGSDVIKINKTPYPGGQVNANNGQAVRILDDAEKTIVYSGLIETLGKWDLFAVKWDGTNKRKLVSLNSYADIYDFYVYPGSSRVFYRADNAIDGVMTLYSINADGTGQKNHSPGLKGNTGVWNSQGISTTHVFFTSDAYRSQVLELFVDPY